MPDLLGDERHERREQPQRAFEYVAQEGQRFAGFLLRAQERWFDDLQVPITELAPEEFVDRVGSFVVTIRGQTGVDFTGHAIEARVNPTVLQALHGFFRRARSQAAANAVQIHEYEARSVPNLVGKGAIAFCTAFRKSNVCPR